MRNEDAIVHPHKVATASASHGPASDTAPDKWLRGARATVGATRLGAKAEEIGRVEEVGDGIALISGLPNVRLDELLQFQKGQFGFAQVLERGRVGCVM